MILKVSSAPVVAKTSGFHLWRIALWLILLLSAFGCLQYANAVQHAWASLHSQPAPTDGAEISSLHYFLASYAARLLAAFALIVFCAAGILRQGWSRPVLRVALVVLAIGMFFSGVTLVSHWTAFSHSVGAMRLQAALAQDMADMLERERRTFEVALAINIVAIPLLVWLAWELGRPAVVAQFRRRSA